MSQLDIRGRIPCVAISLPTSCSQTLEKRRGVYGDLCQEATPLQLKYLLLLHENNIPMVIKDIKNWTLQKGTQKYIPPAFYDRDGSFIQPPSFEIPLAVRYDEYGQQLKE